MSKIGRQVIDNSIRSSYYDLNSAAIEWFIKININIISIIKGGTR